VDRSFKIRLPIENRYDYREVNLLPVLVTIQTALHLNEAAILSNLTGGAGALRCDGKGQI